MTCNNPEHAALENELNDALEETLLLEERLAAYEAAGADTGTARGAHASNTLGEVMSLTDQISTLEKERDAYEQDFLNKKDRINELETQLEDKDQQTKDLVSFQQSLHQMKPRLLPEWNLDQFLCFLYSIPLFYSKTICMDFCCSFACGSCGSGMFSGSTKCDAIPI